MRERLVGALVLLCIGVVLWSMLFTGSVEQKVDRRTQIPPPIVIDRPDEVEPRKPDNVRPVPEQVRNPRPVRVTRVDDAPQPAEQKATEPQPAQADSTPASAQKAESTIASKPASKREEPTIAAKPAPQPKTKPALDADTRLPEAWVVQVGTFGNKDNAENLKEKLQKDGHKAYLKNLKTKKGTLYRVLVGPLLVEADAEAARKRIAEKYAVKPIVQKFER